MAITKSTETFRKLTNHQLSDQSFIRMFNILVDHDRITNFLNIFKSYTYNKDLDQDVSYFYTHNVGYDEWWDNISYKYYKTPDYWWVITSFNDIVNPFEGLEVGMSLRILKPQYLYSLLRDLDTISTM